MTNSQHSTEFVVDLKLIDLAIILSSLRIDIKPRALKQMLHVNSL